MKIYRCLFLFALISCNPTIKKEEPILLDVDLTDEEMKILIESAFTIAENCDMDLECVIGQLYNLYDSLPDSLQDKLKDVVLGGNCQGFCEEIVSEIVGSTIAEYACDAICSSI